MIAGHEIAGTVTRVGSKVTEFKAGDRAGVGAQVWSCLDCDRCKNDNENYCPKQSVCSPFVGVQLTHGVCSGSTLTMLNTLTATLHTVVTHLVFAPTNDSSSRFLKSLNSNKLPPCSVVVGRCPSSCLTQAHTRRLLTGLTTYSPLVRNGAGPGKKVGVVGIGG